MKINRTMNPRTEAHKRLEKKIAEISPGTIPKLMFWGTQRVPPELENKYTYLRQTFGTKPNKKFMFVKIPNIKRLRRTILTRKLLSINHAYSQAIDRLHDPKDRGLEVNEIETKVLEDCKKLRRSHLHKKRIKQDTEIKKTDCKLVPNEKSLFLACNDGAERFKVVSTIRDIENEEDTSVPPQREEELDRKHCRSRYYARAMSRDLHSMDVNLVISNSRMSASGIDDVCHKHNNSNPSMLIVLHEIMRGGLRVHNWPLVCKCLEGLSPNSDSIHRKWISWTGGMLALANIYKNDVSKIVHFHSAFQKVNGGYPVKFGIDTAAWLIQKGYFVTATAILESEQERSEKLYVLQSATFDNLRRRKIDFVAEVINVITQYAIYKSKDPLEPQTIQFAESVLIMFEALIEKSEIFQYDATLFLEPTIELMITIRGKLAVQAIYKKLLQRNHKNALLAEKYLKFLKEHFPDYEGEIDDIEKELEFFNFEYRGNQYTAKVEALSKYIRRKRAKGKSDNFQKLELPGFCWRE